MLHHLARKAIQGKLKASFKAKEGKGMEEGKGTEGNGREGTPHHTRRQHTAGY